MEIPVTYTIAWWSGQDALAIDDLHIEIIQSNLNLLNSVSLIAYTVSGVLSYKGSWKHYIAAVHISERINNDPALDCNRIIEITPVVKSKENKEVNGGADQFSFRNEHTIISNQWGPNRIRFVCGGKEQVIELWQRK